ncbi:putative 36protein in EGT-IAP1 intergenic region [Trichinella pseudospiralis]
MLLIFKRSVIGTCQLVDKAFNVRQKKTGDANCPIDSAPIKADGELKKHVWEQAIDLAPAAFACSIHRYNLTAANCSCHEAGRHQIQ